MQRRLRQRRGQSGFTLIELLVVITILGILAAVVVFAARGSGDKGRAAAVATDTRIVRTALETYCAQNGRYPADPDLSPPGVTPVVDGPRDAMDTLVDEKFLSNRSEYNSLSTGDNTDLFPLGTCPGSPKHYNLIPQPTGGESAGSWANALAPLKGVTPWNYRNMVRLPDGRIFTGSEVYDPGVGADGKWTLAATNLSYQLEGAGGPECPGARDGAEGFLCRYDPPSTMVVIAGDKCQPRYCGKVLTYISGDPSRPGRNSAAGGRWQLYDPLAAQNAERIGEWSLVRENPRGSFNTRAVQIQGTTLECGSSCGKVLMVNSPTDGEAELFDPSTGMFQPVGGFTVTLSQSFGGFQRSPLLESLPGGKVLVLDGALAWTFFPLLGALLSVPPPPSSHNGWNDETAVLPGGKVMVTSNAATLSNSLPTGRGSRQIDVFTPDAAGAGGVWTTTPTCGLRTSDDDPNWSEKYCHFLSGLPGGRILAWTGAQSLDLTRSHPFKGRTYELNPGSMSWSRQGEMNNRSENMRWTSEEYTNMPTGGIFISGGDCGSACNKVLAVNYRMFGSGYFTLGRNVLVAELYTLRSAGRRRS